MAPSSWFKLAAVAGAVGRCVSADHTPGMPTGFALQTRKTDRPRTGNWSQIPCSDDIGQHPYNFTASEQWSASDANHAWSDLVTFWETNERGRVEGYTFMDSLLDNLGLFAECVYRWSDCSPLWDCIRDVRETPLNLTSARSGAAGPLIGKSVATIDDIFQGIWYSMGRGWEWRPSMNDAYIDNITKTFAPAGFTSDNSTWDPLLADLTTLGTVAFAGPYATSVLKRRPWFSDKPASALVNTTVALVRQSVVINKRGFEPIKNHSSPSDFSHFMTRAVTKWTEAALYTGASLLDGSNETIKIIGDVISDGKLVETAKWVVPLPYIAARIDLDTLINRNWYTYAIPVVWRISGTSAFVLDSGIACDDDKTSLTSVDTAARNATGACVDGKLYYLVHPSGSSGSGRFSAPPGLADLGQFGNVTREDLVRGSVRTWVLHGRNNTGQFVDPFNNDTLTGLAQGDVTAPGFVRLPVCGPDVALDAWRSSSANASTVYPCNGRVGTSGGISAFGSSGALAFVVFLFAAFIVM